MGAKTPSPGTNHKNGNCRRSLLSSLNTTRQHLEPEAVGKDQTFAALERFRNSNKRFGAVPRSKNQEQETSGGFYWWDRGGLELFFFLMRGLRIGTGREESGGLRATPLLEGVKLGTHHLPPPRARSRKRLLDVDVFG